MDEFEKLILDLRAENSVLRAFIGSLLLSAKDREAVIQHLSASLDFQANDALFRTYSDEYIQSFRAAGDAFLESLRNDLLLRK